MALSDALPIKKLMRMAKWYEYDDTPSPQERAEPPYQSGFGYLLAVGGLIVGVVSIIGLAVFGLSRWLGH